MPSWWFWRGRESGGVAEEEEEGAVRRADRTSSREGGTKREAVMAAERRDGEGQREGDRIPDLPVRTSTPSAAHLDLHHYRTCSITEAPILASMFSISFLQTRPEGCSSLGKGPPSPVVCLGHLLTTRVSTRGR